MAPSNILLLLFLAFPTFAADYYVDSSQGGDSNNGRSPEKAWKTLDKVNQRIFQPSDRILFRAGTIYAGQLKPRGSGSKAAGPIVIDKFGNGPKPRIDGKGVMPATLHLYNVEYWEVQNLEITNQGTQRKARRCGVYVHIEDFGTAHHIVLRDLDIRDVNGSLVKSEGAGQGILWRNEGKQKKSRFDGLLIEGCRLRRCERNGILGSSGHWRRTDWFPSLNVVIRNNLLEEIPGDGIVPYGCDGALVEYNVMRNCTRLLPVSEAAAGIWPWSCDNTVIQFNEVSDHKAPWDAQGFDSDWNCRNTLIQYNYSHDNEGGFLLVCTNGSVKMPVNAGNVGTVVRYNVSVNDGLRTKGRRDFFSPAFHISGPVEDTKIYNNLISVNKKPDGRIDRTLLKMDNWGGPWPRDTWFANNIFYVADHAEYDYGGAVNTVFENNLYWGEHRNPPNDVAALRVDPLFANPGLIAAGVQALLGCRLKRGSPAIGAGIRIPDNGGRDFIGTPLPVRVSPSIGPFEARAAYRSRRVR
ncbi:MAG: right-handed parallel beta-helix repeat-containing protein [bacterium]|nr:right-handed parallel beta-helix repeat-containing protein [bacterium]